MSENFRIIGDRVFRVALLSGIVYLAYNEKPGWGWLTLVLIITILESER
jgi:hypothetical protein